MRAIALGYFFFFFDGRGAREKTDLYCILIYYMIKRELNNHIKNVIGQSFQLVI